MAPFIDAFVIGEGEEVISEIAAALRQAKAGKYDRNRRLEQLASIPGIYVPTHVSGRRIRKRIVSDLDSWRMPSAPVVPLMKTIHDRITLEIARGCTRGCRFCQAGMVTRPVRERKVSTVLDRTLSLVERTGWEEVGLLSLASCDYSGIFPVIKELSKTLENKRVKVSLPSLRMDSFSVNLAAEMESMRRGGLTFAPEAGTQRLRNVINKGVTDEDFNQCLETAFSRGWDRVKLYFMMGLPSESGNDLDGILELAERSLTIGKRAGKKVTVSLSVAGFVPKPHTPFQWEPQAGVDELREKGRYLKGKLGARFGGRNSRISLKYHEPEQTVLEGVFARGDRRLADAILAAWRKGARFDGWSETFSFPLWMEAFGEASIDPLHYTERRRADDEGLPWDHIDAGVSKAFLLRERDKALQEELSPDCRPLAGMEGAACRACGVEDLCPAAGKLRNNNG